MDPINYSSAFDNLPSPQDALMAGIKNGVGLQQIQIERQQAEAKRAQEAQMRVDLANLSGNMTPEAIASMSVKYPHLSEQFKRSYDMLAPEVQKARLQAAAPIYAAIRSGEHGLASKMLRDNAAALENSGKAAEAKQTRAMADLVDQHPETASFTIGTMLATAMGPDKFTDAFKDIGAERRAEELQPDLVSKGASDAAGTKADVTIKTLGVIGQKAGALAQAKDVKPSQVATMFKSLAASGAIPKDELQDYIDSIPQDSKALPAYLNTFKLAGMKPDDQMKYTTADANTVANNARIASEGAANRANALAVQDRITARSEAAGSAEPSLDEETLTTMAQQYLAGDKSVMQNLGRGAQGSANIVALRSAISREAKAKGMTGPAIAAAIADYGGQVAGLRTSGTISARIENAAAEAMELIPLALEASKEVARSGLLPFGKAQIMFNNQTNNPALAKFATANIGLATAYAGAMARGGKATVSDMEHAREILSTAKDQKAYEATVEQLRLEIAAAQRAPQVVRKHLRDEISGKGGKDGHGASTAGIPAGWSVKEH